MHGPRRDSVPAPAGVASGVLAVTIATYLTYAVGLLSNALVARGLAPADFGRYSYVVWLSGWLVLAINNGLTTSGIRFVAETLGRGSLSEARRSHGYLRRLARYSELLVLSLFAMIIVVAQPPEWRHSMLLFIAVVVVSALTKSRYLFDISIAKGYGQFKVEAYTTVSVGLLTMLAWGTLFLVHAQLNSYVLVFAAASVSYLISARWQLRRVGVRVELGPLPEELRARMQRHLHWSVLLAAIAMFSNKSIEVFFLILGDRPADVGFFTIGASLTRGGIDLLTSGLMAVLMPVMSNAYGQGGREHANRIFLDSLRVLVFCGLLAAGVGVFLAAPTVSLMYGADYQPATRAFQVMVVVSGLTLGEAAFGALLSTTDRQRSRVILVALQVVITIAFAALLIPRYGFIGALCSHAASRLLSFVLTYLWLNVSAQAEIPFLQWLRLALAATLAALVALASRLVIGGPGGDVLAAGEYGALLIGLSIVLRYWTVSDFNVVARSLSRYAPRAERLHRWVLNLTRVN